jgi:AcrR family transcriptional regulator
VGQATLYRNFATRRELLEALYVDEIDEICRAATIDPGDPPAARLETWLRRFYAYFISKHPVATELLQHTEADDPVFGDGYTRVTAAARPLLDAARDAGEIDAALSLEQILDLVIAVAKISGTDEHRGPILEKVLGTLRDKR